VFAGQVLHEGRELFAPTLVRLTPDAELQALTEARLVLLPELPERLSADKALAQSGHGDLRQMGADGKWYATRQPHFSFADECGA
jgi:hypothetical protein